MDGPVGTGVLPVRQLPRRLGRPALRVAVYLAATLVLAVMVGAGVVLGQIAFEYFAAIDRISAYRAYSDYDNRDLYRMLEVVDGSEGWKLLHQSDYGESTVSYAYTLRNKTDTDVLVYQSQIRPTFLDADGFAIRRMQGSGRVVPAGGEFADTGVVEIPNELANQIADFKVLGP